MSGTRFSPGSGTAYVTDHAVVLTSDGVVDPELMARCAAAPDWSALLDATADLTAAVVHRTDDPGGPAGAPRASVAALGDVVAVVETADGACRVAGRATREIRTFDGATSVRLVTLAAGVDLDRGHASDDTYCVEGGVVPASSVSRRFVAPGGGAVDAFDELFGPTMARTVEQAAVRDDEPAPPRILGVVVFSTGTRVALDRSMMLGRNPRPDAGAAGLRMVRISASSVSRRHATIEVDRWRASIDDLGSSNGTVVTLPGRRPVALEPGRPVDLAPGTHVELGGDVSFTVEEIA